jgi:septal ring factor EnvC (AmiA/AmiB activator)
MTKPNLLRRATGIALVLALAAIPLLSGCTTYASKEDLRMLDEAKKAAESAEADLAACKQRRAELEQELAQKKANLAELQNTRETVQKALSE